MTTNAILLVSCDDQHGIVASLSDFVFRNNGNIIDAEQHTDTDTKRFFMRLEWSLENFALDRDGITHAMQALEQRYRLSWELFYGDRRPRVAIFCSKTPHCVYDLLLRQQMGELGGDIVALVSNHETLAGVAAHFDVPFHHFAMSKQNKAEAESKQRAVLAEQGIDLVVLARYMQIVSPEFVGQWHGRMINIHHSFLPSFVGAKPYHQAKARGVKIIGATAHYVTAELDEGPIIDQDVTAVSHHHDVNEMVRKGRDIERRVLGRAVRLHLQRRILIENNRTIVFGGGN